ncbi:solute carrier family 25 member 35-like [Phlebotomus papatasi]|uniref:Mitochondrial oxaloacetate carrier protein n=1 Tax=Phlebotomus papatasi TaxID=29031 RepID=A0A1B0D6P1_PHLPP|nr:solute carrier family 25 member 35-like [Phlebotomus papatasi]
MPVAQYTDFLLGGIASMGATVFTNPLEVIKTRIQLQGELAARGTYVEPYRGIFQSLITVAKHDGITGLQKGLVPALNFQFVLNAFRLGIYNRAVEAGWTKSRGGKESFGRNLFWGATGGLAGAVLSSPFFMIKTHLQSQAVKAIAVGHQHSHTGMSHAFKEIYRAHGFSGLYRGVLATIPRAILGSGGQLATFGVTKDMIKRHLEIQNPLFVSLLAGMLAGSVMAMTITPPDVIATRLFNQGVDEKGKGIYYRGVIDCCIKVVRAEGIYGLYKGFWATYLRIGPHATLVLMFFDQMVMYRGKLFGK